MVSAILVSLFDFLMSLILFAAILLYYKQPVSFTALFYWPLASILGILATLGPGCLLAALNVKYSVIRYAIPFVIQVLLFLSPVLYPVDVIHNPILQQILSLMPIYSAIELFRLPLTGHLSNEYFVYISIGSNLFFLLAGLVYFRRSEDFFADLS